MASVLELSNGELTATVRPEMGGSITAFRIQHGEGAVDLLRPASAQAVAGNNALDSSSYPLVPYSNRIENGLLRFGGQTWRSGRTFPDHPHTLHGHGYKSAWAVDDAAPSSGALSFEYEGPDFPGVYRAVQVFTLSERSLSVEISVKNTGRVPMPAGLGFHPFFPKPEDTQLEISLGGVWLMAANDGIPTERVPVPPEWDFSRMREIGDLVLDHCFTDWESRRAVIAWPSRGLRTTL
jgi:aldose 1-epimerase